MSAGYCRLHYIRNWQEIVRERKQKARSKLSEYVEHLSEKHGSDFVEVLQGEMGEGGDMKKRLHGFGFREEFETGEHSPFAATGVKELITGMESDD